MRVSACKPNIFPSTPVPGGNPRSSNGSQGLRCTFHAIKGVGSDFGRPAPARIRKLNLQGEHIVLVLQLLRAWGYPVLNDDGDLVDQDGGVGLQVCSSTELFMELGPFAVLQEPEVVELWKSEVGLALLRRANVDRRLQSKQRSKRTSVVAAKSSSWKARMPFSPRAKLRALKDHWDARAREACQRWRLNHGPPCLGCHALQQKGF